MKAYADLADLEEDDRITAIGNTVMRAPSSSADQPIIVGVIVDDHVKADRYVKKLQERFPGIRVIDSADRSCPQYRHSPRGRAPPMTGYLAERESPSEAPTSPPAGPRRASKHETDEDPMTAAAAEKTTPEEEGRSYPLIRLDGKDLKSRLKKMKPFMSTEEARYYLNGIFIHYENQRVTLCATNGHVLQEQVFEVEAELSENLDPFSVICPRVAIDHLIKVIPGSKDAPFLTMQVLDDGTTIRFDFFEFEYITNTVDGEFPDYKNIIPAGKVNLQKGLNASYLIDALKALNNTAVDICIDSNTDADMHPHLLTSSQAEGIRCVIMPMINNPMQEE